MALGNAERATLLSQLEEETLKALVKRVQKSDAPSSDLVLAWNILKDIGIVAKMGNAPEKAANMFEDLPVFDDEPMPEIKEIA